MSTFDAEIFAHAVLEDVRRLMDEEGGDDLTARNELSAMRKDIEATLAALEIEKNGKRARALRQDLEVFLPVRRAAIIAAQRPYWGEQDDDEFCQALDLACRATVIIAKAFTTSGGM